MKILNYIEGLYWKLHFLYKDTKFSIRMEYQRIRYGYSDENIWNLKNYLADTISELVFTLSKTAHGYPSKLTQEKWNQILKDISFGFASFNEMESGFYPYKSAEYKRLQKDYEKGMKLFQKYFGNLWD